jgi:signal transduction histidine kinase
MVEQVLSILNSLAKQKKLVIVNRVDPSVTIYQFYEPLKILLYNLLTNAIRFTEKGSISVEFSQHEDKSVLSVKDEGIGMTPEQIQRITADEVVITAASVDNKKGHGLGYLIIKDLLKMIVGKLEIDSSKGKGTTVSITMQK